LKGFCYRKNMNFCLGKIAFLSAVLLPFLSAFGEETQSGMGPNTVWESPASCGEMSVYDIDLGMCEPLPMEGMPMKMLMLHGNIFGAKIWEGSPRGRTAYVSTNMVMADLGSSLSDHHYLNLDLMATAEKWTLPNQGYPLLLQIGEKNSNGQPFIDAQHPHSSPIMGLTLSDTISFGRDKDHLKFFFAPRGEATDGPIAFMHRITGMVNPDAPLGHHVGQDVGHISSTVIGASLQLKTHRFEISTYHGAEPEPTRVDLPLGNPDSVSLRFIEEFTPEFFAMVSAARVNRPEPDETDVAFENRYSASAYYQKALSPEWSFYNTFIYGLITQYDHANALSSFAEEFLLKGNAPRIWGRVECLQRTPSELGILNLPNQNGGRFFVATTLGYTHRVATVSDVEIGIGGSATHYFLPSEFTSAYNGNPWSGKVFLEFSGMKMFDL
jgi:hypothetical protein